MMNKYVYRKLNAFAFNNSGGNPAACLYLTPEQKVSDLQMLQIARQHKGFVSEVIYCTPYDRGYKLRYFSSECEVEFCGHGTIACMYSLVKHDENLIHKKEILIYTNKGILKVYNELKALDAVYITTPDPEYIPINIALNELSDKLRIMIDIINKDYSIQLIDAGLRTLIVPICDLKSILEITPKEELLKTFCEVNGIDIILVFTTDVTDSSNKIRTRVFAPRFGYLEDPATGSGNSAMGYYMLKHGLWDGSPITIEQNGDKEYFNIVKLKTMDTKVLFGGNAITKIEGEYYI